jgi:hypothetical protein
MKYDNIVANLKITDNEGTTHNRKLEEHQIKYFPVIKNIIKDIKKSNMPNMEIPIILPEFTTIEDYDDLVQDIDHMYHGCEITAIRLMGPSLVASFLGIEFDINVKMMGKYMSEYDKLVLKKLKGNDIREVTITIGRTQKSLDIAKQQFKEYYGINVLIRYEHPFLKIFIEDDPEDILGGILCESTKYWLHDNHIVGNKSELWLGFKATYFNYVLADYGKENIRVSIEARINEEKKVSMLTYNNVNPLFIEYMENYKIKYPLGKDNDWKILCSITKDHSLYHICQDFVLDLLRNMLKWWLVMDDKTFMNVLSVLKHFKELNNFIWDNTV